jgi:hypothetical protein
VWYGTGATFMSNDNVVNLPNGNGDGKVTPLGAAKILENLFGVRIVAIDLMAMQQHLNALGGFSPTSHAVEEQAGNLRSFTDDQLKALVSDATHSDLDTKPTFYQALVNVCADRQLFV